MATVNEYAQLASIVYAKTDANELPFPSAQGWTQLDWIPDNPLTGFSAGVFRKGNEIVIAYTGTNGGFGGAKDHLVANLPAANGLPSPQVQRAIELYLSVKATNPDVPASNISFTGHSLGGGGNMGSESFIIQHLIA